MGLCLTRSRGRDPTLVPCAPTADRSLCSAVQFTARGPWTTLLRFGKIIEMCYKTNIDTLCHVEELGNGVTSLSLKEPSATPQARRRLCFWKQEAQEGVFRFSQVASCTAVLWEVIPGVRILAGW